MKTRVRWMASAAALLVGASAAIAAEVAIGILLYAGPGLMRSLTTVLAVEGGALAAGLWSSPVSGPAVVDRLRRRWLFCLATFILAAFFSTSWSVVQGLGGGPVSQGLGLAVLAALPIYACGMVLGGMSVVAAADPSGGLPAPGPAAAFGAAFGFVMTGLLLPRAPIPASLLIASLVLLSASGLLYGMVLAFRPVVHVRAARSSAGADVRVEDRLRISGEDTARYLLESGHVRRRESLDGEGLVPWDVTVARALVADVEGPRRVLVLGGGASALPREISDEHPHISVDILERNPAVVDLARDHFDTAIAAGPTDRVRVRMGNLEDLLTEVRGPYDLVLVDTAALAPLGGVTGLSRSARASLASVLGRDGVMVVGPGPAGAWFTDGRGGWRTTELRRANGVDEVLLIGRPEGVEPLPGPIGDFAPSNGARPEQ